MKELIPFEAIEELLIEKSIYKPNKGKQGRPSTPKSMTQKNLILNEGTLVDATLIHSSEPKRKKDETGKIISNKAHDEDASYTPK